MYKRQRQWYPTAAPAPQYGLIPLLAGTLWVSLAAILIALPLGPVSYTHLMVTEIFETSQTGQP